MEKSLKNILTAAALGVWSFWVFGCGFDAGTHYAARKLTEGGLLKLINEWLDNHKEGPEDSEKSEEEA